MEKEEKAAKEARSRMRSLIVHGGAWQIPDEEIGAHREGLRRALARGVALLRAGRPALDVVVETVAVLEDDPTFDAGRGSVLNLDGRIEMDAAVMEGRGRRAGACACVTDVAHPIRLARAILEDGRAVLLAGEGASRFARACGIPPCSFEDLLVPREVRRKEEIDRLRAYETRMAFDGSLRAPGEKGERGEKGQKGGKGERAGKGERGARGEGHPRGTVGAVCFDAAGEIAAATSTGGAPDTWPGRVGDSPILGAGTWAEEGAGGASATGWGEAILRDLLAYRTVQAIDSVTILWREGAGHAGGSSEPARRAPAESPRAAAAAAAAPAAATPLDPNAPITWGPVVSGTPGSPAARAALSAIESFARGVRGVGGVILLGPDGTPGFAFNTPRMARGYWVEGMGEPWIDTEPA